jgi:hypothetical protein
MMGTGEARFLREWIEYHLLVGVQHFWIFDHNSTDGSAAILRPYIDRCLVTYTDYGRGREWTFDLTIDAYRSAILSARGVTRWMGMFDMDEYLVPLQADTLAEALRPYVSYGGLVVNWHVFGTSGVREVEPQYLAVERLQWRAPVDYVENQNVKSIVQPARVRTMPNQHYADYTDGFFAVDVQFGRVSGHQRTPPLHAVLSLNHYFLRDERYMREIKINRGKAPITGAPPSHFLGRLRPTQSERDTSIHRFLPAVRSALNKLAVPEELGARLPTPYTDADHVRIAPALHTTN